MGNIINPVFIFEERNDGEDEDELVNLRIHRRQLRDVLDPFSIPQSEFIRIYRLDKKSAIDLIDQLIPIMPPARGPRAIPNHIRILVALNFFASGSYQRRTGNDFANCVSQTMVSRCVQYVSDALSYHLLDEYVQFPSTEQEIQNIQDRFFENSGFQGIIGAVDGSQIAIFTPSEEEHLYVNRKGFHSLNAMIACTYDLIIIAINARFPGSSHDSFVWRASVLRSLMQRLYENGRQDFWLVGDSAYPLEPWLMTPIVDAQEGTPEYRFTRAHIAARNAVERCIGVLKTRFRCLLKDRTLHYAPLKAANIVNSCVILHNICVSRNIPVIDDNELNNSDDEDDDDNDGDGNNRRVFNNNNIHNLGIQSRNRIINSQFRV